MKRPSRLLHMTPLGVDRMAALADASMDPNLLRMENIDTDLLPHHSVVQATKDAVTAAATNSYIPLLGQDSLRKAIAAHVSRQPKPFRARNDLRPRGQVRLGQGQRFPDIAIHAA